MKKKSPYEKQSKINQIEIMCLRFFYLVVVVVIAAVVVNKTFKTEMTTTKNVFFPLNIENISYDNYTHHFYSLVYFILS